MGPEKKLSKNEILRLAIKYIKLLSNVLDWQKQQDNNLLGLPGLQQQQPLQQQQQQQFTFLSLCRFSLSFLLSLCWILPFSYFTLFFGFIPPFFPILPFESRRKSPPGGEVRCCYPRGTTSAE